MKATKTILMVLGILACAGVSHAQQSHKKNFRLNIDQSVFEYDPESDAEKDEYFTREEDAMLSVSYMELSYKQLKESNKREEFTLPGITLLTHQEINKGKDIYFHIVYEGPYEYGVNVKGRFEVYFKPIDDKRCIFLYFKCWSDKKNKYADVAKKAFLSATPNQ